MSKKNTKLPLLLNVEDDKLLFSGKGSAINTEQQLEQTTISGRNFYWLNCTIIEGSCHLLVDDAKAKLYSKSRFIQEWKK